MSDDLHKDKLEDFLKKAFEEYSDQPAGDLWDRIEQDLPPEPKRRRAAWLFWTLGSLLLIVAGFVLQHFYFKKQIKQVETEIRQSQALIDDLEAQLRRSKAYTPESVSPAESMKESAAPTTEPNQFLPANIPPHRKEQEPEAVENERNMKTTAEKSSELVDGNATSKDTSTAAEKIVDHYIDSMENSQEQAAEVEPSKVEIPAIIVPEREAFAGETNDTLTESQETLNPENETVEIVAEALPNQDFPAMPLAAATQKKGFIIGANVMPSWTWQSVKPENNNLPPPPPGRPRIDDGLQNPAEGYAFGIMAGYAFDKQWSVWSGLQWQNQTLHATHKPRLPHRIGKCPEPGGSIARNCEFEYDLFTSGGEAQISLRVEQVDTMRPIPRDELVNLELKTTHRSTYFSVPFLAKYTFGTGRWHGNLRTGFIANFLTDTKLTVDQIESLNVNFRPNLRKPPSGKIETTKKTSFDLVLGAGLEYEWGDRFFVSLEPTFSAQLTDRNASRMFKTSGYALGLSAGIFYRI